MQQLSFAPWVVAAAIASGGVWLAEQFNPAAAWWLVTLILLSVLIARPGGVAQLEALMTKVFGRH